MSTRNKPTTVGAVSREALDFTAGKDVVLDQGVLTADCIASARDVTMLSKTPVKPRSFSEIERETVITGLNDIIANAKAGKFKITPHRPSAF